MTCSRWASGLPETMLELFADLPPDHEYFRQFRFIARNCRSTAIC